MFNKFRTIDDFVYSSLLQEWNKKAPKGLCQRETGIASPLIVIMYEESSNPAGLALQL